MALFLKKEFFSLGQASASELVIANGLGKISDGWAYARWLHQDIEMSDQRHDRSAVLNGLMNRMHRAKEKTIQVPTWILEKAGVKDANSGKFLDTAICDEAIFNAMTLVLKQRLATVEAVPTDRLANIATVIAATPSQATARL